MVKAFQGVFIYHQRETRPSTLILYGIFSNFIYGILFADNMEQVKVQTRYMNRLNWVWGEIMNTILIFIAGLAALSGLFAVMIYLLAVSREMQPQDIDEI